METYSKPKIFAHQAGAHPSLSVISGQEDANGSGSDPRGQHEGPMKTYQDPGGSCQGGYVRESLFFRTSQEGDSVVGYGSF